MNIDYCLILGAGLGTRMGEVGKHLPKVLWPLFEKTLLELQISVAKKLGAQRIFLNTHHLSDVVSAFLTSKNITDVEVLYEKEILDIGGAIHNLASLESINYQGKLLILNCDQFFFLGKKEWEDFLVASTSGSDLHPVTLLGVKVLSEQGYNELVLDNGSFLVDINRDNEKLKSKGCYYTHSGISIIQLDKLTPTPGVSSFFDSVADYKKKKHVYVYQNKNSPYYDLGNKDLYYKEVLRLLDEKIRCDASTDGGNDSGDESRNKKSALLDFLEKNDAIKSEHINFQKKTYENTSIFHVNNARIFLGNVLRNVKEKEKGKGIYYKNFCSLIN